MAILVSIIFVFGITELRACEGDDCGKLSRLDFVNIGTLLDETNHEAAGWGPIEPHALHGNAVTWGGILTEPNCDLPDPTNCDREVRVTWAGDCFRAEEGPGGRLSLGCLPPAGTKPFGAFDPATSFEPDSFALLGRAARVVLDPNAKHKKGSKSRQLTMRVLDGISYDSFEVFIRNIKKVDEKGQIPAKPCGDTAVLVYRFDPYAPENLETKVIPEQWRVHTINLESYEGQLNLEDEPNALEVIIQSTAVPWGLFFRTATADGGGYGQLAVDWIELIGAAKKRRDH